MWRNRGARKRSGGIRGSQNDGLYARLGEEESAPVQVVSVEELIKMAKTDMRALTAISENISSFSAKLQAEAFDVFCHHLQTPVEELLCEKDDPYDRIMDSIKAIRELHCSFFERNPVSKQRFADCWPNIFQWLKVLLKVRDIYDQESLFSGAVGEIYNICLDACPSIFEEDEVLEFAVRAWIGIDHSDREDNYTARPLLACLGICSKERKEEGYGYRRAMQALHACDITEDDLVDKIISRINREIRQPASMNTMKVLNLSELMKNLLCLGQLPRAALEPSAARCFVAALKTMLDVEKPSPKHLQTADDVLRIICVSLSYQIISYAMYVAEEGILSLLPRISSFESGSKDDPEIECSSMASELLKQMLLGLSCDYEMIDICQKEMEKFYLSDLRLKAMLKASPKSLKDIWEAFENALLKNVVLLDLFRKGYAKEVSICANRDCRKRALREKFKKCAGCFFALYCSRSCQMADWKSHRNGCKAIGKKALNILHDRCNRLPRRMIALHVNRHWDTIIRLSRKKKIPLKDVAIRIDCNEYPFQMQMLDCHKLLDYKDDKPHLAMAANELLRQSEGERRDWVLVILRTLDMEYPCLVNINEKWTRNVLDPRSIKAEDYEPASFVDEDGNAIACGKVDTLCAGIRFARKFAAEMGKTVWDGDVIHRAACEAFVEYECKFFEDELSRCFG
ncbi:hypothetical protein SCHPADRAFT_931536 [Schizopora paradoxa]|uniref:MYND-type domain-containing protein n=1 Tax=Schizopora paradoxa TaxID=27342 RepID=A0A0H2RBQ1_9AGAM|nr:hypothetical protein SCHPADRAFT_931536 [Schizopora paradoxa]